MLHGEDNTSLNYVQCNIALALIVCLEQWMSGPPTHTSHPIQPLATQSIREWQPNTSSEEESYLSTCCSLTPKAVKREDKKATFSLAIVSF